MYYLCSWDVEVSEQFSSVGHSHSVAISGRDELLRLKVCGKESKIHRPAHGVHTNWLRSWCVFASEPPGSQFQGFQSAASSSIPRAPRVTTSLSMEGGRVVVSRAFWKPTTQAWLFLLSHHFIHGVSPFIFLRLLRTTSSSVK